MDGKVIVKFKPGFLFKLSESGRYLAEMRANGWKLIDIKFGCLLYFRECKAIEEYYYITQFATLKQRDYKVGMSSLLSVFRESYVDNRVYLQTKLVGVLSLKFTVYCFSKEDREKVELATESRKADLRLSVFLFIDYFFTNFICLPIALYVIVSGLLRK